MVTEDEVRKIASLSRLELSPEDLQQYTKELNDILGYVEQLKSVDVSGVQPLSHVHGSTNVFRSDELEPSLDFEEIKKIAPDTSGRFFRVPLIIE